MMKDKNKTGQWVMNKNDNDHDDEQEQNKWNKG
jgi:hypothetical protein